MKITLTILWTLLLASSASAGQLLVDGKTTLPVNLSDAVSGIKPGTIVIVSEQHDLMPHHQNQIDFLSELGKRGGKVSVGMEFFPRYRQEAIDQFLAGKSAEEDFLKAVEWSGDNFDFYRSQVGFPLMAGGKTIGLNTPRWLTAKIVESGFESLSKEDLSQLPEDFTLGSERYKERFREAMGGHHIPECAFERYFTAQSAWDDTMAETACNFVSKNPEQVLTVIVGDFHASYGGGLPDRLRARGCSQVVVVSQVMVDELSSPDANSEIAPDPKWGPRGDYVWAVEKPAGYKPSSRPSFANKPKCTD